MCLYINSDSGIDLTKQTLTGPLLYYQNEIKEYQNDFTDESLLTRLTPVKVRGIHVYLNSLRWIQIHGTTYRQVELYYLI